MESAASSPSSTVEATRNPIVPRAAATAESVIVLSSSAIAATPSIARTT